MSISELTISDTRLRVEVIDACTGGTVDISTGGQTEISLEFVDPGFALLASNIFQRKMPLSVDGLKCEIAVVETGRSPEPMGVQIKARSYAVQKFKRTKDSIVRRNISPTDWLIAEAGAVGATVVAQSTTRRSQIARVNTESQQTSTWDVMSTLAGELGFLFFEVGGVFYFGKPSWLIDRAASLWTITYGSDESSPTSPVVLDVPQCRSSENATQAATVELILERDVAIKMRPGDPVTFTGVPLFAGKYMVDSVNYSLLSTSEPVSVSLTTPIDPEPSKGATKKKKAVTESDGAEQLIDGTALSAWEQST